MAVLWANASPILWADAAPVLWDGETASILAGTSTGTSTASAIAAGDILVEGASAGVSTNSGSLTATVFPETQIAGSAAGSSSAGGNLTVASDVFTMWPRVYLDLTSGTLETATNWTEITAWVKDLDTWYGRNRGVDEFQPGQGSVRLDNRDGRFDPSNTASPYYPNLRIRRRILVDVHVQLNGVPYYDLPIAHGWLEALPQQWRGRNLVDVQLTWTDALGALSGFDLPDSVWDYAIGKHIEAGRVVAWYRWDDQTSVAVDSSGNNNHGRYVIAAGVNTIAGSDDAPEDVIHSSRGEANVIPAVERSSLDIGRMFQSLGQPAVDPTTGTWRFPAVVLGAATDLWGRGSFSVETWVRYRAGFSPNSAGEASSTEARCQSLCWWGDPYTHASSFSMTGTYPGSGVGGLVGLSNAVYDDIGNGYPEWLRLSGYNIGTSNVTIDDGKPHQVVLTVTNDEVLQRWVASIYVDGVLYNTDARLWSNSAMGFNTPAIVGFQHRWSLDGTPQPVFDHVAASTIGDMVFYNVALTATQVRDNHRAGRWANLNGDLQPWANEAVTQALEMANVQLPAESYQTAHTVQAGLLQGRGLIEVCRQVAVGEAGVFFQEPDGTLRFVGENWRRSAGFYANDVQFTITDGPTSGLTGLVVGMADCDFIIDDALLKNTIEIRYAGGTKVVENAASIATYGRVRTQINTAIYHPNQAQSLGEFELWKRANPLVEIGEVTFDALVDNDSIEAASLHARFGRRIRVIRTRPNGTVIDGEYWVQSIRHRVEGGKNGEWLVTLGLTPADQPGKPFLIGTSKVGSTDEYVWI